MYDTQLGRWHAVDPLADTYSSFTPYMYAANNPLIFIDPDGQRVKLGNLLASEEGIATFISIVMDLATLSGINKFTVSDGYLVEDRTGTNENQGSARIRKYVRHLLNDQENDIELTSYNTAHTETKPIGWLFSNSDLIRIGGDQMETWRRGALAAGVNPLTVGYGIFFLHESLHSKSGASFFNKDHSYFAHSPSGGDKSNEYNPGRVEEEVNNFRKSYNDWLISTGKANQSNLLAQRMGYAPIGSGTGPLVNGKGSYRFTLPGDIRKNTEDKNITISYDPKPAYSEQVRSSTRNRIMRDFTKR
jgi:hypothetical protein